MIRIVAGKYRHRIINIPEGREHIRPTKDRIREAIFSALGDITNFVILDLYAGSGAMGLEALSRNAKKCYFVDINETSIKTIKSNLSLLKIDSNEYQIFKKKDLDALDEFKENNLYCDIIFVDPPYALGEYDRILDNIFKKDILGKKGIIVLESNRSLNIDVTLFSKIKTYQYGDIIVTICWR